MDKVFGMNHVFVDEENEKEKGNGANTKGRAIKFLGFQESSETEKEKEKEVDKQHKVVFIHLLNEREREFFKYSMANLLKDCIDSCDHLSVGFIGRAVGVSIVRAEKWREAQFSNINQKLMGLVQWTGPDRTKHVTVDEMYSATYDLGLDILEGHPTLQALIAGDEQEEDEELEPNPESKWPDTVPEDGEKSPTTD